ncbi:hypothetical protein KSS87_002693 [Heliosperma pusillum]|nr:hypothetical protein KSS87_002693 [Heliosperma pusillum]
MLSFCFEEVFQACITSDARLAFACKLQKMFSFKTMGIGTGLPTPSNRAISLHGLLHRDVRYLMITEYVLVRVVTRTTVLAFQQLATAEANNARLSQRSSLHYT